MRLSNHRINPRNAKRRAGLTAALLIFCVVIVAFWEIMANRSRRPFQPFQFTAADLKSFAPESAGWSARFLPVKFDPIEPVILAFEVKPEGGTTHGTGRLRSNLPVLVRLAHGYNMPDCMRIKGYTVELMEDRRNQGKNIEHRTSNIEHRTDNTPSVQVWRLTSATDDVSVWVTSMLRLGDFNGTDIDVRSMAFPRIGIPDNPGWLPRGMTWKSLHHPIRNFRWLLLAKWNNARCDLATFLKLKQPAWASEDLLTLVAAYKGPSVKPDQEDAVSGHVLSAHDFIHSQLTTWRRRNME